MVGIHRRVEPGAPQSGMWRATSLQGDRPPQEGDPGMRASAASADALRTKQRLLTPEHSDLRLGGDHVVHMLCKHTEGL